MRRSPLTDDEVVERFLEVRTWARGGVRAPHKPLVLLSVLARLQRGEDAALSFRASEGELAEHLRRFGPPRGAVHPEYGFWRLRSDAGGQLWQVVAQRPETRLAPNRSGDVRAGALRAADAVGRLDPAVARHLADRPSLVNRIASGLLDANWEPSLHSDILDAVGLPWVVEHDRPPRDPEFRRTILRIYERRCAFCGYDGRLGDGPLAVDAAHVKWHAAGGPDTADNGVALCTLHHRAFDSGALGLAENRVVMVSQHLTGGEVVAATLFSLAGRSLRPPIGESPPAEAHMSWHRHEVFRAPAR